MKTKVGDGLKAMGKAATQALAKKGSCVTRGEAHAGLHRKLPQCERWTFPKAGATLPMKRITFEEFRRRCNSADTLTLGESPSASKTRVGTYWTIIHGLSVTVWFLGVATDEDEDPTKLIIEDVT